MRKRTALITGATQGIGLEFCKLFAADGYNLVMVARDSERLDLLRHRFQEEYEIKVQIFARDLTEPSAPSAIFDALKIQNVIVDVLVNNAGFGNFGLFTETDWETERNMIQLNITSLTQMTKLFLPDMLVLDSGGIINVASTAAFMPGPLMAVYYATKAYVLSFSQALAEELKDTNITINTLCPGHTATEFSKREHMENSKPFTPVSGIIQSAEEVAREGYRDFMHKKPLTITGTMNKMMIQSLRFSPRKAVTKVTRWLMDKRQEL